MDYDYKGYRISISSSDRSRHRDHRQATYLIYRLGAPRVWPEFAGLIAGAFETASAVEQAAMHSGREWIDSQAH
jgi:hypothetical protein